MPTPTEKLEKMNVSKSLIKQEKERLEENLESIDNQIKQMRDNKIATLGAIQICEKLLEDEESENVDS